MSASLARRIRRIPLRRTDGVHIFYLHDGILKDYPNVQAVEREKVRITLEWRARRKKSKKGL